MIRLCQVLEKAKHIECVWDNTCEFFLAKYNKQNGIRLFCVVQDINENG